MIRCCDFCKTKEPAELYAFGTKSYDLCSKHAALVLSTLVYHPMTSAVIAEVFYKDIQPVLTG